MEKTSIQKLTEIQEKVGYTKGSINSIALLGLFGEAGEVINECRAESTEGLIPILKGAIEEAKLVDSIKKKIRNKELDAPKIVIENEELFDNEMGDVLYYLNAIAINRGKTLEDYAEISYQKVIKKSQTDITHGNTNEETLKN